MDMGLVNPAKYSALHSHDFIWFIHNIIKAPVFISVTFIRWDSGNNGSQLAPDNC